ncbi:hypothetical protein C7M84_003405 [Penaeus vannamei]|uniref:EF-hand domain-containing protein n=1 Tax=Penaeus vannamei TaxID=6689 RepID=A0A3R7PV20_PENVA|nr:hypothetical protein C7M84_003405 [Penaeus vannamei]
MTLQLFTIITRGGPTVVEALYRHKSSLETIFRLIDKDNSGYISMDEFSETCELLSRHIDVPIPKEDITDLARSIDINKDGYIDFNEFLECFIRLSRGFATSTAVYTVGFACFASCFTVPSGTFRFHAVMGEDEYKVSHVDCMR